MLSFAVSQFFTYPNRVAKYCNLSVCLCICLSVCLSVCLSARIIWKPCSQTSPIFVHVAHGRGSVLLWWCCNTLCASGFTDDVMFSYLPFAPHTWLQLTIVHLYKLYLLTYFVYDVRYIIYLTVADITSREPSLISIATICRWCTWPRHTMSIVTSCWVTFTARMTAVTTCTWSVGSRRVCVTWCCIYLRMDWTQTL